MYNNVTEIQQIEKNATPVMPAGQADRVGRVIMAIATTGRREVLTTTLAELPRQTLQPDLLVLSITGESDIDRSVLEKMRCPVKVRIGSKGACHQRNRVLELVQPKDVVVFTDDDFLMSSTYLERIKALFNRHPDVVMATGKVLADGISGPGYSHAQGLDILDRNADDHIEQPLRPTYNGYGCNMAFYTGPVVEHGLRFDESLPLYAWLEDVDFSRQIARYGRVVRSDALAGVHLGTKGGRTNGKTFGYSQISNPLYLMKKGTMIPKRALSIIARNILANIVKTFRPEPWVDRRGRLYGNLLGVMDLARGRLDPEKVLEFRK